MPPQDYEWLDVFEILSDWFDGNTDKNSTYLTIRFLWWNRIGTLLQFIAGLSILVEIIGKERMRRAMVEVENSINSRKLIALVKKAFNFRDEIHDGIGYAITLTMVILYWLTTLSGPTINHLLKTKEEKASRIKDAIQSFVSDNLWLLVILAVIAIIIFLWEDLQILLRNLLGFPVVLLFQVFRVISLIVVEIFLLKPAIFYMKISQRDKHLKAFSFLVLILGFTISFIFS